MERSIARTANADETRSSGQNTAAIVPSDLAVLDDMMAAGHILPSQQPSTSDWSAEKRLAAAVLASALVEIRDHHATPSYRRRIEEDVAWIVSDEADWPYSFVRLCHVFDLDPEWVREVVRSWLARPTSNGRPTTPYRQAA